MPDDALAIHDSHRPETAEEQLLPGMTFCKVCCRLLVADRTGVRARAIQPCEGRRKLVLRDDGQVVVTTEVAA